MAIATFSGVIAFVAERLERFQKNKRNHKPYGSYEKYLKRPLDAFLATGALIVLSPVLVVTGALVRIKLGSPILFIQERPGKDEKIFRLYKFRTMLNPKDGVINPEDDAKRLTPFGERLRSTSLDELPELINIIKGDMSIVGSRPLLFQYLERYNEEQARRHEVRPGLTGLAQVKGRNTVSWEEKFKYDVEYVDNITFAGDCKIVLDTVKTVLKREGINSDSSATMEEFMGSE